jgi:hypothetical protein
VSDTIHSCHDQCQKPMCVLRRERDKERALADRLAEGLRIIAADDEHYFCFMANFYLAAWKEARSE